MFTILFGLHLAIRAVIDWLWNGEPGEGDHPVHSESRTHLDDYSDASTDGSYASRRKPQSYASRRKPLFEPLKVDGVGTSNVNDEKSGTSSAKQDGILSQSVDILSSEHEEVLVPVDAAHVNLAATVPRSQEPFDVTNVHGYFKLPYLSDNDSVNFIKHSHTIFIMRGLPGSGKSTLVKCLQEVYRGDVVVCSADDFFLARDGTYKFAASKLPDAHQTCQHKAEYHCDKGTRVVVIDNTNIQRWEMAFYLKLAQNRFYYHVIITEPQTPWRYIPDELANRNKHNVGSDIISKKLQSLRSSSCRPLYYGWFLCKEDSSMLAQCSRDIFQQCVDEGVWTDSSVLEDILDASFNDPRPMLHCTAAYLAGKSKDPYHTDETVDKAISRTFTLNVSGFVYSKRATSARVNLRLGNVGPGNNRQATNVNLQLRNVGFENGQLDLEDRTCIESDSSNEQSNGSSQLLHLYVKDEEEVLRDKYRDVYLGTRDSDEKHAVFHHGSGAHITISYAIDGESKHSGEEILNILELEFYGKLKQKRTRLGLVSMNGQDSFQIQLDKPIEVTGLFHGFYSSRGGF